MNEQQRDTDFLTRMISYDDTPERRELSRRISRAQTDERCVRRAVWLMALFAGLATAGLCYAAVFLLEPMNMRQFLDYRFIKVLCALALGSFISLAGFIALGKRYRGELAARREECRCLTMKIMEARFGKQVPAAIPLEGVCDAQISEAPLRTAGVTI
jgi:hypothetical protein